MDSAGHHFEQQSITYQNITAWANYTATCQNWVWSQKSEVRNSEFKLCKFKIWSLKSEVWSPYSAFIDTCPSGFYGLQAANHSKRCLQCQCSNKTANCTRDSGWFVSEITTSLSVFFDNTNVDGWTANNSVDFVEIHLDWGTPAEPVIK